jgi:hypothetical protein
MLHFYKTNHGLMEIYGFLDRRFRGFCRGKRPKPMPQNQALDRVSDWSFVGRAGIAIRRAEQCWRG